MPFPDSPLKKSHFLFLLSALLFAQWLFLYPEGDKVDLNVITGDGRGYYDYLTSIFVDGDLTHQEINGRFILDHGGRGVNKYYVGTALLMLPFFLFAWLLAWLFHYPIDGFSLPFQGAMCLSALSYTLFGIYFLSKLIRDRGVSAKSTFGTCITLTLATNLLYYTALDVTASHVYSFFSIAAWAWFTHRFLKLRRSGDFIMGVFYLTLLVMIRPVNAFVLAFIPYLADQRGRLKLAWSKLSRSKGLIMLAIGFLIAGAAIQLLLYRIQAGSWILWSYSDEGFYFLRPAFVQFLFGFKRGWFVYSPIFLFLLFAYLHLLRTDRRVLMLHLGPWLGLIYVLSSWWSWHYGGSYGSRPMIDFYAVLVLPMAHWLDKLKSPALQRTIQVCVVLCACLTFFQIEQLRREIISAWNMNQGKYFWSFGKLDKRFAERIGGRNDTPPYHHKETIVYECALELDKSTPHWSVRNTRKLRDGQVVLALDQNVEYNLGFNYRFTAPLSENHLLTLSLDRYELDPNAASEAFVVIELRDELDTLKLYDAFLINERPDMPLQTWQPWTYQYAIPGGTQQGDLLRMYLWNKGKKSFYVRDVRFTLKALQL
jgi:hypothetical protein